MSNAPALRADNIGRHYIDGDKTLTVLKGVSLTLNVGEVVALVGRSGSGKSTLLHILGLLDTPNEGEVLIDGTPAGRLSEKHRSIVRNARIGFVFQHFFLLPDFNVLENVLMPAKIHFSAAQWSLRRKDCEQRARELLDNVGLGSHLNHSTRTLSGGERQRVALARALFLAPKLLLCDEPTGNLDRESGGRIMDLIFESVSKGTAAAMVVTHDAGLAERAHRRLHLEAGVLKVEQSLMDPAISNP